MLSLFRAGEDAGAIVQALYGLSSKGGKPYMAKLSEVQAIIRQALPKARGVLQKGVRLCESEATVRSFS